MTFWGLQRGLEEASLKLPSLKVVQGLGHPWPGVYNTSVGTNFYGEPSPIYDLKQLQFIDLTI